MDQSGLSRRRILAGVALAGSAGALTGVGTGAVLADRVRFENRLSAGTLDLRVGWNGDSSAGPVPLEIEFSDGETRGEEILRVSLPDDGSNNQAYAWLGATCPTESALLEHLELTISYADCTDETALDGSELVSGSLLEVAETLTGGVPLDGSRRASVGDEDRACLQPGDELCLLLEWVLDPEYAGEETTAFEFRFVGQQCRHGDATANPFTARKCDAAEDYHGISHVEIYVCDDEGTPELAGKLELSESGYCGQDGISANSIEVGQYVLYPDGDACDEPTGYFVDVRATRTNEDGETIGLAFELVTDDGGVDPELCRVDVKGGPGVETYDGDDFDGNATNGVLTASAKSSNGGQP